MWITVNDRPRARRRDVAHHRPVAPEEPVGVPNGARASATHGPIEVAAYLAYTARLGDQFKTGPEPFGRLELAPQPGRRVQPGQFLEALRRLNEIAPSAGRLGNLMDMVAEDTPMLVFSNVRRLGMAARQRATFIARSAMWPLR